MIRCVVVLALVGAAIGFVCVNYGFIANPRTVGFRFRYNPQESEIAPGTSLAKDASWIIPPP